MSQKAYCHYCGSQFTKKRNTHKYCRSACRVAAHRERNGIEKPDFLKQEVRKAPPTVSGSLPPPTHPEQQIRIRHPQFDIKLLESQRIYWENTLIDLDNGIFPAGLIIGSLIGATTAKDDAEMIANGFLGGVLGAIVDDKRKKALRRRAETNIDYLNAEIHRLEMATYKIKDLQKNNMFTKPMGRQKVMDILGASDYKAQEIPELKFGGKFGYLMGNPSPNFYALLHGMPGNGKSTLAVQFADYFERNHGKVLYLASEQHGLNKSFQGLLKEHSTTNFKINTAANKATFEEIIELVRNYKLVVFDSINHMKITPDQIEELREKHKDLAILAIMQSTKDGNFKGSQDFAHNADIIIQMENMKANQTKSRFAAPATVSIFSE